MTDKPDPPKTSTKDLELKAELDRMTASLKANLADRFNRKLMAEEAEPDVGAPKVDPDFHRRAAEYSNLFIQGLNRAVMAQKD